MFVGIVAILGTEMYIAATSASGLFCQMEMSDLEDAIGRVEDAVIGVQRAINDKMTSATFVCYVLIGMFLFALPGKFWHSKWRYAWTYELSNDRILISDEPHDCAFLAAPLGDKYCHYERKVSTLRRATSTTGNPIQSSDDGKTWTAFEPEPNERVPKYSTVEYVFVIWEKKDD